ncbi:unnamed protein product [Sphagnum jensenii]|uniref:AAA+ ATPase domain-containing protein n=1 Tax=Sphagnum jensenii TaxID=128206 RepID=A0ABP0V7R0_9BRYO
MSTLLALDLGTNTGWAISTPDGITSGSQEFRTGRFENWGMRFLKFKKMLTDVKYHAGHLDAVYFEAVRRHAGVDAAHVYGGFMGHLAAWCEHHTIPYQGVPVGTIKKFATGKGNASKFEMMEAVKKWGHHPHDDNEADALALLQQAIRFLRQHGVGVKTAERIYQYYGNKTIEVVTRRPFELCTTIERVGFKTADKIACSLGLPKESEERLHIGGYSRGFPAVAKSCQRRAERPAGNPWSPSFPDQQQALDLILSSKVCVLTGGPGTGKTTLVNALVKILTSHLTEDRSVVLCAPTGKAAKNLKDKTGQKAFTIHRTINAIRKAREEDKRQQNNDQAEEMDAFLNAGLIVVDEISMVNIELMHSLLNTLSPHSALLLVGDVDQLPAIGAGNVLSDILQSCKIPVARLTTLHRQAALSGIIRNAHRAGYDPVRDIQVLSPMKRWLLGIENLNLELQEILNPEEKIVIRFNCRFAKGDKVMQTKNNYKKDVMNGETGIVKEINENNRLCLIDFDGDPVRSVAYTFDEMEEIILAYAMTIHKSQGSEYPAIVIPLSTSHSIMLRRNLLYTAITRGQKHVFVIGQRKAIDLAIADFRVENRHTKLSEWLQK